MTLPIICLILSILFIPTVIAGFLFAPWVPAWKKDLPRIFKLADLKPGEIFYDLGCGDGRTVIYANKHYQAKAVGLEISILHYLICKVRQLFNWNKNLQFRFKNLYKQNLADADVVYFFGMPKHIETKLKNKLEAELKKGARIISYAFDIPAWQPVKVDDLEKNTKIFLYQR